MKAKVARCCEVEVATSVVGVSRPIICGDEDCSSIKVHSEAGPLVLWLCGQHRAAYERLCERRRRTNRQTFRMVADGLYKRMIPLGELS
jgi:carbonic anhydrase